MPCIRAAWHGDVTVEEVLPVGKCMNGSCRFVQQGGHIRREQIKEILTPYNDKDLGMLGLGDKVLRLLRPEA